SVMDAADMRIRKRRMHRVPRAEARCTVMPAARVRLGNAACIACPGLVVDAELPWPTPPMPPCPPPDAPAAPAPPPPPPPPPEPCASNGPDAAINNAGMVATARSLATLVMMISSSSFSVLANATRPDHVPFACLKSGAPNYVPTQKEGEQRC